MSPDCQTISRCENSSSPATDGSGVGVRVDPDDRTRAAPVFFFHLTDQTDLNPGARRPRENPEWPEVGIFGHWNMRRPRGDTQQPPWVSEMLGDYFAPARGEQLQS